MRPRPLLLGLLCLAAAPSPADAGDDLAGVAEDEPCGEAAALDGIQQQLDAADEQIGDLEAERIAVWNVATAASQEEHDDVGQGALVLVVAVARSAADLPLRRVHVAGPGGRPVPLGRIGTYPPEALRCLRLSGKAGPHVWAGLYLLRAARATARGPLLADFATRPDVALGELPAALFGALEDRPARARLRLAGVARLATRAFPGVQLEGAAAEALERARRRVDRAKEPAPPPQDPAPGAPEARRPEPARGGERRAAG